MGSLAVMISGVVILSTGWRPTDPIRSLLSIVLILASRLRRLGTVVHTLLGGVPRQRDLAEVGRALAEVEGWKVVLTRLRERLDGRFGISQLTRQPEPVEVLMQSPRGARGGQPTADWRGGGTR